MRVKRCRWPHHCHGPAHGCGPQRWAFRRRAGSSMSHVVLVSRAIGGLVAARRTGDVAAAHALLTDLLATEQRLSLRLEGGRVLLVSTVVYEDRAVFGRRCGALTIDAGVTAEELAMFAAALDTEDPEATLWRCGRSRIRLRWARDRSPEAVAVQERLARGAAGRKLDTIPLDRMKLDDAARRTFREHLGAFASEDALIAHLAGVLVAALRRSRDHQSGTLRRVLPHLHQRLVAYRRLEDADALAKSVTKLRAEAKTRLARAQADLLLEEFARHRSMPCTVTGRLERRSEGTS